MSNGSKQVQCRQIAQTDIDAVVDLLATGFPDRSHDFWRAGLRRLAGHRTPPALPRFGYLLEVESKPVGVLLVLSSFVDGGPEVRCNVAAWFVVPHYRSLAPLLAAGSAVSAPMLWIAPGRWPGWYPLPWIAAIAALALARRTRGFVLQVRTLRPGGRS